MNDTARAVIARGLVKLGIIEAEDASFDPPWVASCAESPAACRQSALFYSHGLGHGIGLEVHDPAHVPGPAGPTLAVGDAFTIEPGVYVSRLRLELLPDTPRNRAFVARVRDAVARYHGIGVRIEDDYFVTTRGVERITTVPREDSAFSADWTAGLAQGSFATIACPSWLLAYIQDQAASAAGLWDVATVPGQGGNWGGSWLSVPEPSKHPAGATGRAAVGVG
jgi:hypothetical protein